MSTTPEEQKPLYLETSRPVEERVRDLLSRMTLNEKISQMTSEARAIPRFGMNAYNFWNEALHGVARNGRATVFPQAIGMAATWDPALIRSVASAIADEGRAKHHAALKRKGSTDIYQGLTFWSPNVNIFRDPRWGRGQETWGEDPYLTGEMGSAFVRGLQGDDPRYLKTAACAKHYAVHSGPEKLRHHFNVDISPRELNDTYLPAFKKLVTEANVEAVMGAYNRVNGEAVCANPFLLQQTLRDNWGFKGHVVSDCWALTNIHRDHKQTRDAVETAAVALKAGCDLSCMCTYDRLGEAIDQGLITEADIDRALSRTLATRFKLGMFDPPEQVPYANIPLSVVGSDEHCQLARQAARESIVLLKNSGVLPIREDLCNLLVVGPTAIDLNVLMGNYHGFSPSFSSLLEGIIGRTPEGMRIEFRQGALLAQASLNPTEWSVNEASWADLTIACMGISPLMEGEEGDTLLTGEQGDRASINLPAIQVEYIKKLVSVGGRVVLVLTGGSPLALGELLDLVEAVVWVWYPGQEGGNAVADVLFGDVSPSGKLPVTFPKLLDQLPPFEDYRMEGRTYRYMTAEPLFPFGFGLSYTRFAYRDLRLEKDTLAPGEPLKGRVTLENFGERPSDEVVQFYLSDLEASVPVPGSKLVAFERVSLRAGESRDIEFALEPEKLAFIGEDGLEHTEPGEFRLTVGGCSPGERGIALGAPQPVSAVFRLRD